MSEYPMADGWWKRERGKGREESTPKGSPQGKLHREGNAEQYHTNQVGVCHTQGVGRENPKNRSRTCKGTDGRGPQSREGRDEGGRLSEPERKKVKMKSLSRLRLFATPWTLTCQAPLSVGFSRQEYWSGLPFSSPGDLPHPAIEPGSPALRADALPCEPPGKP